MMSQSSHSHSPHPADPVSYGLSRDMLEGRAFPPCYTSEHRSLRISMKLFNRTPADLPLDLGLVEVWGCSTVVLHHCSSLHCWKWECFRDFLPKLPPPNPVLMKTIQAQPNKVLISTTSPPAQSQVPAVNVAVGGPGDGRGAHPTGMRLPHRADARHAAGVRVPESWGRGVTLRRVQMLLREAHGVVSKHAFGPLDRTYLGRPVEECPDARPPPSSQAYADASAGGLPSLLRHLLHATGCNFWWTGVYTAQLFGQLAVLEAGVISTFVDYAQQAGPGGGLQAQLPPPPPAISGMSAICVATGPGSRSGFSLGLTGQGLETPGLEIIYR